MFVSNTGRISALVAPDMSLQSYMTF